VDGTTARGIGDGFSAFLGMSRTNSLWIGSMSKENMIVDEKLVEFGEGDLLIVPYGTLHAGDKNRRGVPLYKIFSEVYTKVISDSTSQLWAIEGKGYTTQKQQFQLGTDRCIPPSPLSKKRKKN
jgi:hypothetical protein